MTISTTTSRISYNGNGVTTIFAVPFRFFANTDLVVQLVTISTGASSTLTLGTHYTVTGADDEDGGSLTMGVAPAVGQRLVIRRVIGATQDVDYVAGDPFPAETHERALDRLTMLAQQGEEVNARALVFPSGDTANGELPAVAARASRLLGFDAAGNLVVSAPASGSAADLALSLATTSGGAPQVGFTWATLPAAINRVDWGIQTASTGYNVLRLVPVAEWAAIFAKTSIYNATSALQAALNIGGNLHIPDGLWNTGPLTVSTTIPTVITMGSGVDMYALPGYGTNDRMLVANLGAQLTIYGNGAVMRGRGAEYTSGEQRHIVASYGAHKFHIYNLRADDSGGDGFYVGGVENEPTLDALLMHCRASGNRRQGASVVNAVKCHIIGGIYENTSGADPQCGIDIESNLLPGYFLSDILVQGVRTKNNNGGGILVTPQSMSNPVSITVRDCVSEYDGIRGGLSFTAAMASRTVAPATDPANIGKIYGRIFIDNITIINPQGRGMGSVNWTENAPDTHIGTVTVLNPCSNPALDTNDIHRCAFLIRSEVPTSGNFGTSVGNFRMDNLIAVDNRTVKRMAIPLYLNIADEVNKPLKNVQIGNIDAVKDEWTSAALGPLLFAATRADDWRIGYRKPRLLSSGSATLNGQHAGTTLFAPASAAYTLPLAANYLGMEIEFWVRNAGTLNVTPNAADLIDIFSGGVLGNAATSNVVGSKLRIRAAEANRWEVVSVVGTWT